jgi:chromosome segregation ATPase
MGNLMINRTPDLIAAEINSIKNQTRNMVLYNSIEIGRRLVEAKELVPHGEWGKWLEGSVDYSQSTAQNLMKIFNEYGSEQLTLLGNNAKSQALGNLSYTQAVVLLALPEEEREKFVNDHDIDNMSTRELQQTIKERDEALKKFEDVKKAAAEKNEEALKFLEAKQKAEADKRLAETVLRETQADVKRLQDELEKKRKENRDESTRLELKLKDLQEELKRAKVSDNSEEVENLNSAMKTLDDEISQLKQEKEELERQLKKQPIETTAATVEKVPEEVEKELSELREQVQVGGITAKFKAHFDMLVKNFSELLGVLADIEGTDAKIYDDYKRVVIGLLGKMSEKL